MGKEFYECEVCGDIHYGEEPPEECPTCLSENAYEEIEEGEAIDKMGL